MDRSGGNVFFKTVNQGYGENWKASDGVNPLQINETPEYRDLVSIHLEAEYSFDVMIFFIASFSCFIG